MIRLTLFLGGLIWAIMAFAPELEGPVFTEVAAVSELVSDPVIEPEIIHKPVAVSAPAAAPEPTIEIAATTPAAQAEPEHIVWYITGSRVNVREGPSTNYAILDKVLYGDAFQVVSDPDAKWIKIRIEGAGVEGYIVKSFTTEQDPLR